MIYGYTRVSTRKQVDGYGLEVQKNEILNKYPTATIINEQYTGTKLDRPVFNKLLDNFPKSALAVFKFLLNIDKSILPVLTFIALIKYYYNSLALYVACFIWPLSIPIFIYPI